MEERPQDLFLFISVNARWTTNRTMNPAASPVPITTKMFSEKDIPASTPINSAVPIASPKMICCVLFKLHPSLTRVTNGFPYLEKTTHVCSTRESTDT